MIFRIFFFSLFLFPCISFGDLQYRPTGSVERHDLSVGFFMYPFKVENLIDSNSGYFLDYSLYFPEIHKLFRNKYKHFGQLGLTAGVYVFDSTDTNSKIKNTCLEDIHQPLLFQFGMKARVSYLENFSPVFEFGWASLACSSELSLENIKSIQFKSTDSSLFNKYVSLGLDISFKVFDRRSVYNLDEDYGINDMGLNLKCTLFLTNEENSSQDSVTPTSLTSPTGLLRESESHWLCQTGLSILF